MTHDGSPASGADDDDSLVVESLEAGHSGRGPRRSGVRRVGAEAARALWGRRLNSRGRLARGALIVTLIAATLFALLGGPALTVAGWQRLTFALHSGVLAPRLPMTDWRRISAPPGVSSDALTYFTNPVAPTTIYACRAGLDGVIVWRTDTLGANWIRAMVTQTPAQSCQVKAALDSGVRLLLVARSPDPRKAHCERLTVYISPLTLYAWSPVNLPPTDAGVAACHGDAWASAHWLFAWWTDAGGPEPSSNLMRSADLGATWQQADGGLPARGAYLAPALTGFGAGGALLAQVYYWPRQGRLNILRQVVRSLDSGATWEALARGLPGATLAASLEPLVAAAGAWGALYSSVYSDGQFSPPWIPDEPPAAIQALDSGSAVWRPTPPLPVSGADARSQRMGVATTLGVAPANDLLTLGADPHLGVTKHVDPRDLWLWAWDPVASEWRLGLEAPPNARLVGFTWSMGPADSSYQQTYGAYLWLSGEVNGRHALFYSFIPAASAG